MPSTCIAFWPIEATFDGRIHKFYDEFVSVWLFNVGIKMVPLKVPFAL